jgi:DNA-binding XRE family transcriptional regulator
MTQAYLDFARTFGLKLMRRRVDAGMKQTLLAELAGVHRNTLMRWERGQGVPNVFEWDLLDTVLREREGRT